MYRLEGEFWVDSLLQEEGVSYIIMGWGSVKIKSPLSMHRGMVPGDRVEAVLFLREPVGHEAYGMITYIRVIGKYSECKAGED